MSVGPVRVEAASLLAMGDRALHVDGDLTAARAWFGRAYEQAEEANEWQVMAAAALGLGGLWVHEHRSVADAASVEARQRTALSLLDPRSPLALRLRARLAAESDYRAARSDTILPIVEDARRSGDPVTLAEVLSLAHHCLLGPEHADLRLGLAEELMREGSRTHRPSDAVMGLLWRTVDLFLLGDPHAERSFAELAASAQAARNSAVDFARSAMRVMLSIRSGDLGEAERLAEQCAERGREAGDADHVGWYGAQMVAIRWYQGRIGEFVDVLSGIANSPTLSAIDNGFLAALAVAAASAGDHRMARGAVARLRDGDLGALSQSSSWLVAMNAVVEAAALLGDVDTAAQAYALLLPHARLPIMASLAAVCVGSTHHALGVASLTTGEFDQAIDHFRTALEQNTALGHWPAAAMSRFRLGQALTQCGEVRAGEAELVAAAREAAMLGMVLPAARRTAAVCTRTGRHWRIDLGSRSAVVDDSVGMGYLATLIANPAVEIPAIDLAEPRAGRSGSAAQAVLDEPALRQYRQRLRDLREEIDEADAMHDGERAARLRSDADWLADELQAATGLGGRTRQFADNPERARIAVGKAIRRALDRVGAADPVIGEQLRAAITTGMRCSYQP
jgi:tetratricopeptide (TPR) repeat protein